MRSMCLCMPFENGDVLVCRAASAMQADLQPRTLLEHACVCE